MAAIKTLDDYISRVRRKYISDLLFFPFRILLVWAALSMTLFFFIVDFHPFGAPFYYRHYPGIYATIWILSLAIILSYLFRKRNKRLGEKVWKVECPECLDYIPFDSWVCPCDEDERVNQSIFIGCNNCGTKYGKGEMDIGYLVCKSCGHKLDFGDEYDFKDWSVLENGETHAGQHLSVKRAPELRTWSKYFLYVGLIGLVWTIVINIRSYTYLNTLFFIKEFNFPPYHPEKGMPIFPYDIATYGGLGLSFIIFLLYKVIHKRPHRLVKNPKYRRRDDEEET